MASSKLSAEPNQLILALKQSFSPSCRDPDVNHKWKLLQEYFSTYLTGNDGSQSLNYYNILLFLLEALRPTLFTEKWHEELYDNVFLKGVLHDSFMAMLRTFTESRASYQQDKILKLLSKFLQGRFMESMFKVQCSSPVNPDVLLISSSNIWDDLITLIVSLPERVANKLKQHLSKIFSVSCYIPLVTSSILKTLEYVYEKLSAGQNCTLGFLGKLIGRLCSVGHANVLAKIIVPRLIKFCESDYIWRRVVVNMIGKVPALCLESFITQMFLCIPWYGYVDWIIGDEGIENDRLGYIIKKTVLLRCYEQDIILQNIFGYLATSPNREAKFCEILSALLGVWSDKNVLQLQSFNQQYYLARAIMTATGWLNKVNIELHTSEYRDRAIESVQIRIGHSDESIRTLGMVVGQNFILTLDPNSPKIDFEYPETKMVKHLKDLMETPHKPDKEFILNENDLSVPELELKNEVSATNGNSNSTTNEQLDSDDDLEAYDMSHDVPSEEAKYPLYLRDCLLGLIEQEKPDWTEQCLKHAERLIRLNAEIVHEVAIDMAKILLCMDDKFSISNFVMLRYNAMVALAVSCPAIVAKFLLKEFYQRDHSIRDRLDILDVLAAASQELSNPKLKIVEPKSTDGTANFAASTEKQWRKIIEERIEANTRRFRQPGLRKPPSTPQANRFASVAGMFMFPLLSDYDKNEFLDLKGDDTYLLGRMLYALGIIMYSATNTLSSRQMGTKLLEFIAAVRNNVDIFVRQAAVFATTAVYMSVPSCILLNDLQEQVMASQEWLKDVISHDPDTECQIRASNALNLLFNIMKEELPLLPPDFLN